MKKTLLIAGLTVMTAFAAFAGPHGCGGHHPHHHHHYHHHPGWGCGWGWGCSRDLGNAAAITSIVANGISILGNLSQPRYVVPVAVPQQPVVVQPQPVVVVPAQPTVVYPAVPSVQYCTPASPMVIYR